MAGWIGQKYVQCCPHYKELNSALHLFIYLRGTNRIGVLLKTIFMVDLLLQLYHKLQLQILNVYFK